MDAEPVPMADSSPERWRHVHSALGDPVRIRMFEALWLEPRSARELAERAGLPPDRVYYHLRLLERAGIIRVSEYRPLPGGKVERVYARAEAEPPGDESDPEATAAFLGTVLDTTRTDITAAFMAKQDGERREVMVASAALRLTDEGLAEFRARLEEIVEEIASRSRDPAAPGTWVRTLFALADLEDRQ